MSRGRSGVLYGRGVWSWVETQVCKVTINCGHRGGGDRVRHLLEGRVRVIVSGGARVYLPSIPSILLRAPRVVAVRGPGEGGPFGVTTSTGRVLPTALPGRGRVTVRRGGMGGGAAGSGVLKGVTDPAGAVWSTVTTAD